MLAMSVPIAVIRAVFSFSQPADTGEAQAADGVETHGRQAVAVRSITLPADHERNSDTPQIVRTWLDDEHEEIVAVSDRVAPPKDRPHFPTEVSPRQNDSGAGVWRWSPFGVHESYTVIRNEQRRDWRLKYNSDDTRQRRDRLLSAHEKALRSGVMHLRSGNARKAMIALSMAAELNKSDPACRIHLMQAQLALGHVDSAATTLRRALELQPKLAYLDLNLAASFSSAEQWEKCVESVSTDKLKPAAQRDVRFLIGFLQFQRGEYDKAHRAFVTAAQLGQRDELTQKYLQLTRPAGR